MSSTFWISWPAPDFSAMLRGRIPTSEARHRDRALAATAREAERLTPEQWSFFLQGFGQFYDIVIDMDAASPLQIQTLDLADAVVWTFLPNCAVRKGHPAADGGVHQPKVQL